jgi:hypothetical protein
LHRLQGFAVHALADLLDDAKVKQGKPRGKHTSSIMPL